MNLGGVYPILLHWIWNDNNTICIRLFVICFESHLRLINIITKIASIFYDINHSVDNFVKTYVKYVKDNVTT
jgi:hypothetical protein